MKKIVVSFFIILVLLFSAGFFYYTNSLKAVGGNNEVEFIVEIGETYSLLSEKLKDKKLIKSELVYKLYIKLNTPKQLQAGIYNLNSNMSLEEILKELEKGTNSSDNVINITFQEGINIRQVSRKISNAIDISYEEVLEKLNSREYINSLIEKYWFLTEDILNEEIYYPLEGYLFPSTYQIYVNSSVEDIVEKMLNETDKILIENKENIENNSLSIHEIMTLSSMVELEGRSSEDRKLVASVFNNRIKNGITLGSDVTTYYGAKIDDFKTILVASVLNDCSNGYNTRCKYRTGLPVGPIANSSKESILSSISIVESDYFYFVADCQGTVYFTKNINEHNSTIERLKGEGNWCI